MDGGGADLCFWWWWWCWWVLLCVHVMVAAGHVDDGACMLMMVVPMVHGRTSMMHVVHACWLVPVIDPCDCFEEPFMDPLVEPWTDMWWLVADALRWCPLPAPNPSSSPSSIPWRSSSSNIDPLKEPCIAIPWRNPSSREAKSNYSFIDAMLDALLCSSATSSWSLVVASMTSTEPFSSRFC